MPQPIELYYAPTPNGWKITMLLEEAGLPYNVHVVNLAKGDQHKPAFLKISPNGRMPAIVDPNFGGLTIFESAAIMTHIADNYPSARPFCPPVHDVPGRADVMQWIVWVNAGLGPMAGQVSHFTYYAPLVSPDEKHTYGQSRYKREFDRLISVMERQLGNGPRPFLAGDYSIADMAAYPWVKPWKRWMGGKSLGESGYPRVQEWYDRIKERPGTVRGFAVLRTEAVASQKAREAGSMPGQSVQLMFKQTGKATAKL